MDPQTIKSYDDSAQAYAREWAEQDAPDDMYALILRYFGKGPTVDIGCGSGRDVAWMVKNGLDSTGYDASENLLSEARAAFPGLLFRPASLPTLEGVERGTYENVLCETVIMHLDPELIEEATCTLLDLLRPGGTLYLSWRVTEETSRRDTSGRLYSAFDQRMVFKPINERAEILFEHDVTSLSSGKRVYRIIARKKDSD